MLAQGLRGVAAVFVVLTHVKIAFGPTSNKRPLLAWEKLPVIRIMWEGDAWVSIFFVLASYANAMKPIKQARAGQVEAALSGLSVSTFRRTWRLLLPCSIATVLSWIMCQLRLYDGVFGPENDWIRLTTPRHSRTVWAAVATLASSLFRTWADGNNKYDQNQWTMATFLQASMLLFIALVGTVRATPRGRMTILAALCLFSWYTKRRQ
jgi:peptidoglycan/LPS O-acetylase OafA/YrhL